MKVPLKHMYERNFFSVYPTKWGAQSKRKVNIVVIEKWNIKTVRAKGRRSFFSGEAKQNKVGSKAKQEKKRKKEKERKKKKDKKTCLAFAPTLFCFALPLKKFCLSFAPIVFMFHFSITTIFTFLMCLKFWTFKWTKFFIDFLVN